MEENAEEAIIEYLKGVKIGATPSQIADNLNMSRATAVKYLEIMRAIGLVDYRRIGMAKVYFVATKLSYAQHVLLRKTRDLIESIKTADEHIQVLEKVLAIHISIMQTYNAEDREKFIKLFNNIIEKIKKGESTIGE